jgi:membrane protein implicated in regulation of membrane protease activity
VNDPLMQDNVRFINEVMNSWAVQLVVATLLVGLLLVAFTRASRAFDDNRKRTALRIAVAALGVLIVLQAVVTAILGRVPLVAVAAIEWVLLAALWFYYIARFLTRRRSGPGDPDAQRRGAALDDKIQHICDERRGGGASAAGGESVAPR